MKQRPFDSVLDECLDRLRRGETVEACLNRYPAQADQLRPLLITAARLPNVPWPQPRVAAVQTNEQRMLAALAQVELRPAATPRRRRAIPWRSPLVMMRPVALVVILLFSMVLTVAAASAAIPGDTLYAVKRAWEGARLSLAADEFSRQQLASEFAQERRQEVAALMGLGRPAAVEFIGIVEAIQPTEWRVDGLAVQVQPTTVLEGSPRLASAVRVWGQVQANGDLVGQRIQELVTGRPMIEEPVPQATAMPLPNDTPLTTRDHQPGTPHHTPAPDETHHATGTAHHTPVPGETHHPTGTAEHTALPSHTPHTTATPTPTAEPTDKPPTVIPSHTPTPDHTPLPSHTPHSPTPTPVQPEPTATPTPMADPTEEPPTAIPSHTPTPDHTPLPTHTPHHTSTPTPDHTPLPTHTPHPTSTPDHTPLPSHTPHATATPPPSETPHHSPIPTHEPTPTYHP
jgi:hypothetical protein